MKFLLPWRLPALIVVVSATAACTQKNENLTQEAYLKALDAHYENVRLEQRVAQLERYENRSAQVIGELQSEVRRDRTH